jgi:ABC-2 type transport system permease protein
MLHLLKVEWLKIKNYRTFWILLILYIVSFIGVSYLTYYVYGQIPKDGQAFIGRVFAFPSIWKTIGWSSSYMLIVVGLIVIIFVTNEFNYRTHRQNIIDGWSRQQFVTGKWLQLLLTAIITTLLYILCTLFFGLGINGATHFGQSFFKGSSAIFYFFVQTLVYLSLALFLGFLIKRAGLAIVAYMVYAIIIDNISAGLFDRFVLKGSARFFPLQCADELIQTPFLRSLVEAKSQQYVNVALVACFAYVAFFVFFTYRSFGKKDL